MFKELIEAYGSFAFDDLTQKQLVKMKEDLQSVTPSEITSCEEGKSFISVLKTFREAIAASDKLRGENYPQLLTSLLSVGEDGLYSNSLRFIFELIQNVDDCEFSSPDDRSLEMHFDFQTDTIVLTYNERGFTPFNVFAITGIAEAAKNISSGKNEIGEKGIGFKSVFGVAEKVLIESGWFSFELYRDNFTVPVPAYRSYEFQPGTRMTLYVPGRVKSLYDEIKKRFCDQSSLFRNNPILFLNKLTYLRIYYDYWRSMEFRVTKMAMKTEEKITYERDVRISVELKDHGNGQDYQESIEIQCIRFVYPVIYSREACVSRYGGKTELGKDGGRKMFLQALFPTPEWTKKVGNGALYSFLPTKMRFDVPVVCHVPFKLDAARESVDPQNQNRWFQDSVTYLSELLDCAYRRLCQLVGEKIVFYLPKQRDRLFSLGDGKERKLRDMECFGSNHFLDLPIFKTVDGSYHTRRDITCFSAKEGVIDPPTAYRLLGRKKPLFLPPEEFEASDLGIRLETGVYNELLYRAISDEALTEEILDYLDEAKYDYERYKEVFGEKQDTALSVKQIEIIAKHPKLFECMKSTLIDSIRRKANSSILVKAGELWNLRQVLYDDFEIDETPTEVKEYLDRCKSKCICANIEKGQYFPGKNALVLPKADSIGGFTEFCHVIDRHSGFVVQRLLKDASKKLNETDIEGVGSTNDFMETLIRVRRNVKAALGDRAYRSYVGLIQSSGVSRDRFIQELLQNADDCEYPAQSKPRFKIERQGRLLVTEYNETGFKRADVRSLTAIGESTKKRLLDDGSIGEKGVGFKTVFSAVSSVDIYSGEYSFSLTENEPTIPKRLPSSSPTSGTRMEFHLKPGFSMPKLDDQASLLKLCLCLKNIKELDIDGNKVTIEDADDYRTITIADKRKVRFRRFEHCFTVTDESALTERRKGVWEISPQQRIAIYVPEKSMNMDFYLYVGLPTKHKINVPMIIDAPFALTTSREEIELASFRTWNEIVRKEMYSAVRKVLLSLKTEDRQDILRFMKFLRRFQGRQVEYQNDFSDSEFLKSYPYLDELKSISLLPTYDPDYYAVPRDNLAFRFPEAARALLERYDLKDFGGLNPRRIIQVPEKDDKSAGSADDYAPKLNALGCQEAPFQTVFPVLKRHAEDEMKDAEFRKKLYSYLLNTPESYFGQLQKLRIIPVYSSIAGKTEFVSWETDGIFTKKNASSSGANYKVLNEHILPKSDCEHIFGVTVNEMDFEYERSRYNSQLRKRLAQEPLARLYDYLLQEYASGMLGKYSAYEILMYEKSHVPLKNQCGELTCQPLFWTNQPEGYFPIEMIREKTVHRECVGLARALRCQELSQIRFSDLCMDRVLTDEDIETLSDDYFEFSEDILRKSYQAGRIPDELLEKNNMEYLAYGRSSDDENYEFPQEPVQDRSRLANHVRKLLIDPIQIIEVREERLVQKGVKRNGKVFALDMDGARTGAMERYTPSGTSNVCFCQMCKKPKNKVYIETNNIELEPELFLNELRLSLCLECSKQFEALRQNDKIRTAFLKKIRNYYIGTEGTVEIPIGKEETITFTAKHLAEIQEILRQSGK